MFRSLRYLADLSGDPVVYPGHWYSQDPFAALSTVKDANYVMRPQTLEEWRTFMPS